MRDLNVVAVLLSPTYLSPMVGKCHDIEDCCDVDLSFRNLKDFSQDQGNAVPRRIVPGITASPQSTRRGWRHPQLRQRV